MDLMEICFFAASFISKMEENSGVKFHEAHVAMARQWLGDQGFGDIKDINIEVPSMTTEGINISNKTEIKVEKVHIPESFEAATKVVEKFEKGADGLGGGLSNIKQVKSSLPHQLLDDGTPLEQEKWLGSEEEELNWCVSYRSSKKMPKVMTFFFFLSR
jgi:phospholipase D1/2